MCSAAEGPSEWTDHPGGPQRVGGSVGESSAEQRDRCASAGPFTNDVGCGLTAAEAWRWQADSASLMERRSLRPWGQSAGSLSGVTSSSLYTPIRASKRAISSRVKGEPSKMTRLVWVIGMTKLTGWR